MLSVDTLRVRRGFDLCSLPSEPDEFVRFVRKSGSSSSLLVSCGF